MKREAFWYTILCPILRPPSPGSVFAHTPLLYGRGGQDRLDGWQFGRGTRDTTSLDPEVSFGRAAEDFALNPFFFCRQISFSPF